MFTDPVFFMSKYFTSPSLEGVTANHVKFTGETVIFINSVTFTETFVWFEVAAKVGIFKDDKIANRVAIKMLAISFFIILISFFKLLFLTFFIIIMRKVILIFFLVAFLFQKAFAQDYIIGVSPPLLELNVSRGSSRMLNFFVLTASNSTILVKLEASPGLTDYFSGARRIHFYNYSEEDASSWIKPFSNPIELKPGKEEIIAGVRALREVSFLVNIPKDAEPGIHLVRVTPKPYLPTSSIGPVGVQIATVTPITIALKVEGNAIREGKILDVVGFYSDGNVIFQVHFLNTGTVTISARATKIEVYDKNKNLIATISSGTQKVKPGEKAVLSASIPSSKIEDSEVFVRAVVDFLTGSTEKNSTVSIQPLITAAIVKPEKPFEIPIWLIVLIVFVIISILAYKWLHEE